MQDKKFQYGLEFGSRPADTFEATYQEFIAADITEAQTHLPELPESERRGLTLETLRHFHCGYLDKWQHPKSRAEFVCGLYTKRNDQLAEEIKTLPPPSERIIIPTSPRHFNAAATPSERIRIEKAYYKQHAGEMEIFCDADAFNQDFFVVVEGEIDAMSIWQASKGKIPVVAILGCGNWKKTLNPRLKDLRGKKIILLLDGDAAGRKAAQELRDELIGRGFVTATGFLYDALPKQYRNDWCGNSTKIDANDILKARNGGGVYLNGLCENIISRADFSLAVARIKEIEQIRAENATLPDPEIPMRAIGNNQRSMTAGKATVSNGDSFANVSELIDRINETITYADLEAKGYLQHTGKGGARPNGYICPFCGSGTGENHSGALGFTATSPTRFKCLSCGQTGNVLTFLSKVYGIDNRGKEFFELLRRAAEDFRIPYEPRQEGGYSAMHTTEDIIADIQNRCEWKRDNRGNRISIRPTQANLDLIFEEDPNLRGLVGYNQFQDTYSFLKKAPWHSDNNFAGGQWRDADTAELRGYIRRNYAELKDKEGIEDAVVHFANLNAFHPVKQYFYNLPRWDGTKRAENLFIDFLDADDTHQTREVTLNWLLAAVARIFRPGCRYQTALVLHGNQGIGKSYILERIGGQWYSAMVDNVSDPHALDALPNIWIGEFKEMAAMRKSDVNQIKSFLERGADNRRKPYERHATNTPRHCVFGITVNDDGFLRDQTGNRRFLIIHCNRPKFSYVEGLTDRYIAQLWAEVFQIFNAELKDLNETELGKRLELRPETKIAMEAIAEKYVQDDDMTAEIKAHVDKLIPEQIIWKLLPKDARRKFFVDGKITIEEDDLNAMFKTKSGKITPEKQRAFDKAKELCASVRRVYKSTSDGGMPLFLTFYGREQRQHICAAEIYHECFANGDKRKQMYRIQEILSKLDGWQLGDRLQKADPEYPEQRKPYFRVQVADNPLDSTLAAAAELIDEDDLPI